MTHRVNVYSRLLGRGLEIGALHEPAQVPAASHVTYYDTRPKAESVRLFPEVPAERIVDPDVVGNLDTDGLRSFADNAFDFVIISHVIEHLSNPLHAIGEVFRVVKPGGHAVIGIPDKNYTFDRRRPVVTWEHLWSDFTNGTVVSSDEHYDEFLRSAHADIYPTMVPELSLHVARARERCEHTHAWDSATFRTHLVEAIHRLGYAARPVSEWNGDQTKLEYFGLWQRTG